jgi:hypothetical protein
VQQQKTHKENKQPRISARHLADYMAATETKRRAIVRDCKYHRIARVIQHDEAKLSISKFLRSDNSDISPLLASASSLRNRICDGDFERDLCDHNADYIERFAKIAATVELPAAQILVPGASPALLVRGVRVTIELACRLQRVTRTNKVRTGAIMLRYAKGEILDVAVAEWQSAFLFGYLTHASPQIEADPEQKLCLTLDAYSGVCHPAPGNSVQRFNNMEAACESISERWPNISPPPNAIL